MVGVTGPAWTDGDDGRYAGRFPLAVERHAMAQVGRLLPGITTVTSHARYYTLHALVFAEAQARGLDGQETRMLFRRAEVVVGAVSLAHQSEAGHAGFRGVHGGDRIGPNVASGTVAVDALAADRGYVKAGWGFWGPYVGPEYMLDLLATGPGKRTVPGPNAEVAALRAGFDGLWDLTRRDTLTTAELKAASHLCVCQGAASEDGALMRRLLVPEAAQAMHASDRRSQSLRLLLRLTDLKGGTQSPEFDLQKALVYGPERADSTIAALDAADAWTGVVLRNEMVAGWRNLWSHLVDSIAAFMAIDALGEAFADNLPGGTVRDFDNSLPDGFTADGDPANANTALDAQPMTPEARMLGRLFISASRYGRLDERVQAYFQAERDERFQQLTPEWMQQRVGDWADRPLRDFAVWLTHQLVARAERVALTKASFDRRTGRFKVPTRVFVRDGYVFRDSREGGGGVSLRWSSAFQIMAGVGLVEYVGGRWQVTDRGRDA